VTCFFTKELVEDYKASLGNAFLCGTLWICLSDDGFYFLKLMIGQGFVEAFRLTSEIRTYFRISPIRV